MYWIILLIILVYYLWYIQRSSKHAQSLTQSGGNLCKKTLDLNHTKVSNLKDTKICTHPSAKRQDYYPRYKFWWSHIKDLCTRPPYDRIFPPFWNTDYDPNITSDEYYKRLQANHIVCS